MNMFLIGFAASYLTAGLALAVTADILDGPSKTVGARVRDTVLALVVWPLFVYLIWRQELES